MVAFVSITAATINIAAHHARAKDGRIPGTDGTQTEEFLPLSATLAVELVRGIAADIHLTSTTGQLVGKDDNVNIEEARRETFTGGESTRMVR
jgi:hypothetical protein